MNNDPRKALIQLWRDYYKSQRGFEPSVPWSAMMNMMFHKFEPVDVKTGEQFVEYPEVEAWNREIEGFFEDAFALRTNYFFGYFLKDFGRFGQPPKRNVLKLVAQVGQKMSSTNRNESFRCSKCEKVHSPNYQCGG